MLQHRYSRFDTWEPYCATKYEDSFGKTVFLKPLNMDELKICLSSSFVCVFIFVGVLGWLLVLSCYRGAGMSQWWERSPPTNVSRVRFPHPASYICGLSLLLVLVLAPRVFLRVLRFSSLPKNSTLLNWFDREAEGHRFVSRKTTTCYSRKIKTIYLFIFIAFTVLPFIYFFSIRR